MKARAINLIGKELSCRESRYRIMADIARLVLVFFFSRKNKKTQPFWEKKQEKKKKQKN